MLPSYFTEQPESPQMGINSFKRIYAVSKSYDLIAIKNLAAAETVDSERIGWHDANQLQIGPKSPSYYQVTMTFYTDAAKMDMQAVKNPGDVVYSLEINYIDKPLEAKIPNYLVQWNYDLYCYITKANIAVPPAAQTLPATPSWYDTATKIEPSASGYGTQFIWDKSRPSDDDKGKWFLLVQRKKPGQEAYLYPQPMVIERRYYATKKSAEASLVIAGKLKAPGELFGYSPATNKWLCMPQGLEVDGRNWIGVNKYLYADMNWDEPDLYEIAL